MRLLLARLKACRTTAEVKRLHQSSHAQQLLHDSGDDAAHTVLHTALLAAYGRCGSPGDARAVFGLMRRRDAAAWNALLHALAREQPRETLRLSSLMPLHTAASHLATLLAVTRLGCGLRAARDLHERLPPGECASNTALATALLGLYAQCGAMSEAQAVFSEMLRPDTPAWNALISAYHHNGDSRHALTLFDQMPQPDARSFVAACSACAALAMNEQQLDKLKVKSLAAARRLHRQAAAHDQSLTSANTFVANSFIDLFSRCGSMADAQRVFDELNQPSIVSWTTLILGYTLNGDTHLALELFQRIELPLDAPAYVAALNACTASLNAARQNQQEHQDQEALLKAGMGIYSKAVEDGFEADMFVASAAIDMFAGGGDLVSGQRVFDRMQQHDVVAWNALILGYVDNDEPGTALELFRAMERLSQCGASERTYLGVFKAYSQLASKAEAEEDHSQCLQGLRAAHDHVRGEPSISLTSDLYLSNALLDAYCRCGSMVEAQAVFDAMQQHNVVSWTSLLMGYSDNGEEELALKLFDHILKSSQDHHLESRVCIAAFTACATLAARDGDHQHELLVIGLGIFSAAAAAGLVADLFVATAAMTMLCKCGRMVEAQRLFDCMHTCDVVAWNALLGGYVESGSKPELVLELFTCMQAQGCAPNPTTLVMLLSCYAALTEEEQGEVKVHGLRRTMAVHHQFFKAECWSKNDMIPVANMLVEAYGRAGSLVDARGMFDRMMLHNSLSWNSLLAAYVEGGEAELALSLFGQHQAPAPNERVLVTALRASAAAADSEAARRIHGEVCRHGWEGKRSLERTLLEVYGKCGRVVVAELVFQSALVPEASSWNSLLLAHSRRGDAERVLDLFRCMEESGAAVDGWSLSCVLSACSRGGLVEVGMRCFEAMEERYGVKREMEHYHCMVEMLGRAERVHEALRLVEAMPFQATRFTWMALLTACSHSSNLRLAKLAFHQLMQLEDNPGDNPAPAYIFMANLLTSAAADEP